MTNNPLWLDPRAWTVVAAVFALLLGFFGILIWRVRQTYPGFGRWTVANVGFALSMFVFSLRPAVPDWAGVVGANTLLVAASILCLEGAREFRGLRPRLRVVYAAGALAILAVVYFDYIVPRINVRICVMSSLMAMVGILCAVTLLRQMPAGRRFGMTFTGSVFAIAAAVQIARGIYFCFAPPLNDLFAPSWFNAAFHAGATPAIISCTIGWVMLIDERLAADLKEAQARAARANRDLVEAVAHANYPAPPAAAVDAARSEFLAVMSHEIENPLSVVKSMTDLLLGTDLTPRQQEYVRILRTAANVLLRLTNDARDLSRIEAGRLKIKASAFDLLDVVGNVAKAFTPVAELREIDLVLGYPKGLPRLFVGDSDRIRQVIMHLVGNAVKFTPAGQILIAVACGAQHAGTATMRISVTDSGIGIAAERIGSLFERSSQGNGSSAETGAAGGIGLAISKKLVELMGGCLGVESQPGKGSTFWFALPLPVEPARTEEHRAAAGQR